MAVAKNEEEIEEFALDDTAKKMKQELRVFKDIKPFLRKVNREFEEEYLATGQVLDAENFKEELSVLLFSNYNRISKQFKFNIRESFEEQVSPEINALINRDINRSMSNLSIFRSGLILQTTNRIIAQDLSSSISELIEDDKELTNAAISKTTKKKLDKSVDGRSKTISISETETSAEETKLIEQQVLTDNDVDLDGVLITPALIRRVWFTMLDERVRRAHALAHGQESNSSGIFRVGGESLRFPGDPNGSAGNIINCRCAAISSF